MSFRATFRYMFGATFRSELHLGTCLGLHLGPGYIMVPQKRLISRLQNRRSPVQILGNDINVVLFTFDIFKMIGDADIYN